MFSQFENTGETLKTDFFQKKLFAHKLDNERRNIGKSRVLLDITAPYVSNFQKYCKITGVLQLFVFLQN